MGLAQRGFDGDALFTFLLSVAAGVLTLGISHLWMLRRVIGFGRECGSRFLGSSAIAVPGHRLEQGRISADYRSRLDRAAELFADSRGAEIRIIGGRPQAGLSEAQAGQGYLLDKGIPASRISLEEASSNTLENMKLSKEWFTMFDEVILVTNRYHLCRLRTLAGALQLPVRLCAAETDQCLPMGKVLKETVFLHWYWSGWLYASVTRNRRMLDKIS